MPLLPTTQHFFSPQQATIAQQPSANPLIQHTANTLQKPTETTLTPRWAQLCQPTHQLTTLSVGIAALNLPVWLVQQALTAWETATQQGVTFKLVLSEHLVSRCDIVFYWSNQPLANTPENHHPHSTGQAWLHVKPIQNKPIIIGSTIELVEHPTIDTYLPKTQQEQRLYTTLLHEIGHALGLNHGKQRNSIMHPTGWRNTVLSTEDVALFKALYPTKLTD